LRQPARDTLHAHQSTHLDIRAVKTHPRDPYSLPRTSHTAARHQICKSLLEIEYPDALPAQSAHGTRHPVGAALSRWLKARYVQGFPVLCAARRWGELRSVQGRGGDEQSMRRIHRPVAAPDVSSLL
jgi:hypothetical protein